MNKLLLIVLIGIGATAVMDLWGVVRKPLLKIPPPNYGMVGRWITYMAHGQFRHESIAASSPMRGEKIIGWTAHYLIGIAFAAILIGIWGDPWIHKPTIGPALTVGICTVAAPFFLMQPGMGGRNRRLSDTTPSLCPNSEFYNTYNFWSWLICIRLGSSTHLLNIKVMLNKLYKGERNAYSRSFCPNPIQRTTLGYHGLHRNCLRSGNFTRNSFRVCSTVGQKLFNNMADSFPNGRDCSSMGAANSWAIDYLNPKLMSPIASMTAATKKTAEA